MNMTGTTPESPYKGLCPYEEQDRDNFFGRDEDCRILIDKILANRLTLLFAASGVGKSSLLQAAVLPHLKDPTEENLDVVYYKDWVSPPAAELKRQVLAALQEQGKLESDVLTGEVTDLTLKEFLAFCTLFTHHPFVILLDQFEEFFQYQRYTQDFTPFIEQLSAAIVNQETPVAIVISMREDFALELNAFKPFLPTLLFENYYRLEKLTRKAAEQAIVTPVERFGYRYEPELLESLLDDLATREQEGFLRSLVPELMDTVEPAYLQIICSQLWDSEAGNADRTLHWKTYQGKGGADSLLKNYVEKVLNGFSPKDKKLASLAFDHLITRRGTKMAYTAEHLAQLLRVDAQPLGKVLDRLEAKRILRRQSRKGVFWYELYHDLFSPPIEAWNEVYKSKQRNKRALISAGLVVMAGFALYGAYDILENYTRYHLRLSVKRGLSDNIELYRGEPGTVDILRLQTFLAEAGYKRLQVEPDKLFDKKPVADYKQLTNELIGNLPLVERIQAYLEDGQIKPALDLAKNSIADEDVKRSQDIIGKVAGFRSSKIFNILKENLEKSTDPNLKTAIVETIGLYRTSEAFTILRKAQEGKDVSMRVAAVKALGELGDRRAVEPLLVQLNDADARVRDRAAVALGQLGDPRAVEPLLAQLSDANALVRDRAAVALGQLGDVRAVAPLLVQLSDADIKVSRSGMVTGSFRERSRVAATLGQLGDRRAVEPLLARLSDADAEVRSSAAAALVQLGDRQAVEPLLAGLSYDDNEVRRRVAVALGQLGDPRAVEPLLKSLKDSDKDVRFAALSAAVRLGGNKTLDGVTAVFNNPTEKPQVKLAAAAALLAFQREDGLEMLKTFSHSEQISQRQQAAEALGILPSDPGTELLLTLLKDDNLYVRLSAIESLGNIKSKVALSDFHALFKDPNLKIQQAIAAALEQIETAIFNSDTSLTTRLTALEALSKIDADKAFQIILKNFRSDKIEPALSLRACNLLGDPKKHQALPEELPDRLEKLDEQYRRWRQIRDAERPDFSKEEADRWAKQLADAKPPPYWAFTLGYNIARIDPDGKGIELLSHNLADVRNGAWVGIGQVGTVKLLKVLHEKRQDSQNPLFRHAAYRAIDNILIHLEIGGDKQELAALEEWYSEVKHDEEGVDTRVEWTIARLKENNS